MKKNLLLSFVLLATTLVSYAQDHSKFSVELQTTPFALGLSSDKNSLNAGTMGINAVYSPVENLSLQLGFEGLRLSQPETKIYENMSMLRLGAGYVFFNDSKRNTLWELNVSAGNDLSHFGKFSNFDITGDIRFYIKEAFYLGVGAKHLRLNDVGFVGNPVGNTNLFFLAGYRYRF